MRAASYDPTVSEVLGRHFGRQILDTLIDPLVGGINAGDARLLSFFSSMPQIAGSIAGRPSMIRALQESAKARGQNQGSIFRGLEGGLATMICELRRRLEESGATVAFDEEVTGLERRDDGHFLLATPNRTRVTEHVILAVPAFASASIVRGLSPELARELGEIPFASVVTVTSSFAEADIGPLPARRLAPLIENEPPPSRTSGQLLPGAGVLVARESMMMTTAISFTSTKWPRSTREGEVLVRASLGRHGDERTETLSDSDVLLKVLGELRAILEISAEPLDVVIKRFPRSFPQYVSGHAARVARIAQYARLAGVVLAGASYHGIGIPA
ncbi:MAG: protoporphyrinogen oxidase, partial [Gaiellaceae bacterium]